MKSAIIRFLKDEEGATAIEYGVIAGLMAVLLVGIFGNTGTFGEKFRTAFGYIGDLLPKAPT